MGFVNFLYYGDIGIIFCIVQFFILTKTKKNWLKWLPIGLTIAGLIFCLALHLNIFWTNSSSVLAENQYFSLFLLTPSIISFIGCLMGYFIYKLFNSFS